MLQSPVREREETQERSGRYVVSRGDLERDRQHVLDVWERNLTSTVQHAARYDWYYRHNPAGRGSIWLLRNTGTEEIVGTVGVGLRRFKVGTSLVTGGIVSDFAVDRAHRSLCPALQLQQSMCKALRQELPFTYGLPNARAIGLMKMAGYRKLLEVERRTKPLRVEPYVDRLPGPTVLWRVLALPVDGLMRAGSRETWTRPGSSTCVEFHTLDGRFETLWERAQGAFSVIGERNQEFLQWRFVKCPLRRYHVLGLVSRDDHLRGYMICYQEGSQLLCADLLSEDSEDSLSGLLAGTVRWARARGFGSIVLDSCGGEHLEAPLRRLGFVPRSAGCDYHPNHVMSLAGPGRAGSAPISEALADWFFTPADEDYN